MATVDDSCISWSKSDIEIKGADWQNVKTMYVAKNKSMLFQN